MRALIFAAATMLGALGAFGPAFGEALPAPTPEQDAPHVAAGGVGGPLESMPADAVEPPSIEDVVQIIPARVAPLSQLHVARTPNLADLPELTPIHIRQPTLFERFAELNPLQQIVQLVDGGNSRNHDVSSDRPGAHAASATAPSSALHGEASTTPPSAPSK